jgi:hypothetical protein
MDQNEEVQPMVTYIEFGMDNAGYAVFINDRLQYVLSVIKCECEH